MVAIRVYKNGVYRGRLRWIEEYRGECVVAVVHTLDGDELVETYPEHIEISRD
jgi:hypothetical protein